MNESRATLGILYLQKVEGALETKRGAILASATLLSCTHCREFSAVSLSVSPSTHSLTGSIQTWSLPNFCLVMRTSGSLILRFGFLTSLSGGDASSNNSLNFFRETSNPSSKTKTDFTH